MPPIIGWKPSKCSPFCCQIIITAIVPPVNKKMPALELKDLLKVWNDKPMLQSLGYDNSPRFSYINNSKNPDLITKLYLDETFHDFNDIFNMKLNEYNSDLLNTVILLRYNIVLIRRRIPWDSIKRLKTVYTVSQLSVRIVTIVALVVICMWIHLHICT